MIKKEIIKDIHFIRYKPYEKDFNIFKVINEIYIYNLNKLKMFIRM